jgi:hypothetical protein
MIRVIIESPYAGDVVANLEYLERSIRDCALRGEAAFASHKMYTTALDDMKPEERKLGIEMGFAWWVLADKIVFYVDRGWSRGMLAAHERCKQLGKKFECRALEAAISLQPA